VAAVLPTIRTLTERQLQLFFLLHRTVAEFVPDGPVRLVDDDVAEAAAAVAATLETSARGVIYEREAAAPIAQQLVQRFRGLLEEIRRQGGTFSDREAALVFRAIEQGARAPGHGSGDNSYLTRVKRLLQATGVAPRADATPGPLVLP
jgi:hypothetical protein